jgi:hypothetical protein
MGDRWMWQEDCPKCKSKKTVSCYDAPSCMQFSKVCQKCGWKSDDEYWEIDGVIYLCNKDTFKKIKKALKLKNKLNL